MAELLKSKRAFFPKGKQKEFLLLSKADLECAWGDLAKVSKATVHTLACWRREENSMSLYAVKNICKKRNIEMSAEVVIKDPYWNVTNAGKAGGKAIVQKYGAVGGDENYRKKKWHEWWEREGKRKTKGITRPRTFNKALPSKRLAEFFGIMLGDGGISKYQFTITLNSVTDKEYLSFVKKLVEDLFKIPIGVYTNKKFQHGKSLSRDHLLYCIF